MADNAADVAEDYRQALEDLTVNSRIEIATLTNIARENANHGFAIAEALANHIKKAPPSRTLPALYVLDSVVKNVPTPYALYFGPKLYSIFMGAYTKVDNGTRRKMDEMLKTWKEPVPGSISTKPVFPLEQVRPIENALMGARNAAFAAHQSSYQGQQQLMHHTNLRLSSLLIPDPMDIGRMRRRLSSRIRCIPPTANMQFLTAVLHNLLLQLGHTPLINSRPQGPSMVLHNPG
ncbi:hypothetical protein NEMBOFW57_004371 [Staphylotrichum longicolle]|uniref:CID domain-containing protein n=1 Tax=Staphylotrichum longicolle TaxID=669026 RepID=A0AAD4I5J5_9PEZI|nr:hypothetical protein NEMBOFW57_004371 [Staphylotrichum longicolle]